MAKEERYTQIMLEDLKHQIKILAEGHDLLADKLENVKQKIDDIEMRLDFAGTPKKVS